MLLSQAVEPVAQTVRFAEVPSPAASSPAVSETTAGGYATSRVTDEDIDGGVPLPPPTPFAALASALGADLRTISSKSQLVTWNQERRSRFLLPHRVRHSRNLQCNVRVLYTLSNNGQLCLAAGDEGGRGAGGDNGGRGASGCGASGGGGGGQEPSDEQLLAAMNPTEMWHHVQEAAARGAHLSVTGFREGCNCLT